MSVDPDRVRVDLIKGKRKVFLSYPMNSQEQTDFLIMSKFSELSYLSSLLSSEESGKAIDGYFELIKLELVDISINLIIGFTLSLIFYYLHNIYTNISILFLWSWPLWVAVFNSIKHFWHIYKAYKEITPYKKEYTSLKKRIQILSDELNEFR